ncbi:hypothetical protein [Alteromonas sp. C1M14]|uniref:hypothetical protein n=1 Tax=Alteromonas sp. C1M14 TaxID=2841567 RepID=UPI001C09EED0|nr:hypothetical protein [Alteromonas sp. C1M14]MBU2980154.1 hypothetical protein [Alteromonas sp. C1M14]
MNASYEHEYLCPHCGHLNVTEVETEKDMYREKYATCSQCDVKLEIVPAEGIEDRINLIVSVAFTDAVSR